MEENLDKNNELNKEISDNNTKSDSDEIKEPKSEKIIPKDIKNSNSESNSASKILIKMRKKWNQTLRCRHKEILEKLNQQFLLITE